MNRLKRFFLIIDDDPINNLLSKAVLNKYFEEVKIKDFLDPNKALEYIELNFLKNTNNEKIILLLDLNMPEMSGWEFLEKFKALNELIKKQFEVYILSSSIDPRDIERAKNCPLVKNFIEKPITKKIF